MTTPPEIPEPGARLPARTPAREIRPGLVHRAGLVGVGLMILGMDYAALDDLLTSGDEMFPEFFFVVGSIPLLAFLWRRWKRNREDA
ncbi:MAG TPA: hypothetical protein VD793_00920 [Gemmatimonadales bacterium]|nr:hypothetical protein [Gemmatimonadales bacterium]